MVIRIKRVYDAPTAEDGARFLVERLWPRGVRKVELPVNAWLKDAAPSTALRRWFNHDPAKWAEFTQRYRAELDATPAGWRPLLEAAQEGDVTLLFSAHDVDHNNAVVLQDYVQSKLRDA
jgi:uncharacterized protein YeaO (DUF488 family)